MLISFLENPLQYIS